MSCCGEQHLLYLWTDGDTTTTLAEPIEVSCGSCSIVHMHGSLSATVTPVETESADDVFRYFQ